MDLPKLFRSYLESQKVSSVTIKNYVADINNFLNWLTKKTGIKYQVAGKGIFNLFNQQTIEEYKTDLIAKNTPLSTINRRLSALRKFGYLGLSQGWLNKNELSQVKNLRFSTKHPYQGVLIKFKRHLERQEASQITINNYLSDLRHFLSWLELKT
ncbi:MAG TPA: site-specific integrase [Patescibacteria group bacterium]|nr:site-specific integrase [Patescibacteria group bacterium]